MNLLSFVNTNKGVAAVRRHDKAENHYFTQVWLRDESGEWRQYHYYTQEKNNSISSEMLESLYQNTVKTQKLPYEDFW